MNVFEESTCGQNNRRVEGGKSEKAHFEQKTTGLER